MKNTEQIKALEAQIAALEVPGYQSNPAVINQILTLKNQLQMLKSAPEPTEQEKERAKDYSEGAIAKAKEIIKPGDTMLDIKRKADLDLQQNVEKNAKVLVPPTIGPATEAETLAAKPYERIGTGGFFAGPQDKSGKPVENGVKAVAKAVGPAAAKAVAEEAQKGVAEEAQKGVLYPPPQTPTPPPGEPDGAPKGDGIDFAAVAKKLGIGVLELVNAFAMGQAGITDPSKLAAGQRMAREQEAAQLKAAQDQAKAELDYQVKKDQLDRIYNTIQQNIQNKFTKERDAEAARVAAAEAEEKYQHDLGLIRAELENAPKKQAAAVELPDWMKASLSKVDAKNAAAAQAAAAGSNEPKTISSEEAHALEAKRKAEAAKRGKN
jgi:hypothetical protein